MRQKDEAYYQAHVINIVREIRKCLLNNRFGITINPKYRIQRETFKQTYDLKQKDLKDLLLKIMAENFCYSLVEKTALNELGIPYVFVLRRKLSNIDVGEKLYINIIINVVIMDLDDNTNHMIVDLYEGSYKYLSDTSDGGNHGK